MNTDYVLSAVRNELVHTYRSGERGRELNARKMDFRVAYQERGQRKDVTTDRTNNILIAMVFIEPRNVITEHRYIVSQSHGKQRLGISENKKY
jgi:hypothetical protein